MFSFFFFFFFFLSSKHLVDQKKEADPYHTQAPTWGILVTRLLNQLEEIFYCIQYLHSRKKTHPASTVVADNVIDDTSVIGWVVRGFGWLVYFVCWLVVCSCMMFFAMCNAKQRIMSPRSHRALRALHLHTRSMIENTRGKNRARERCTHVTLNLFVFKSVIHFCRYCLLQGELVISVPQCTWSRE